jgi:cation diffusion facilitator CzcD-associated flavoprotein CzcO
MFPSRDQVIDYFEHYARKHELEIRFRTHVERIERDGAGWLLQTSTGAIEAGDVVVAAGYEHTFHVPKWPGRDTFAGRLIHSAEYRNADEFRGADVLVVGPGSSGMEIAYDLVQGGASRVRLAVRTPPNVILREPLGPLFARLLVKLPAKRADRVTSFMRRKMIGDLAPYGLPEPEEGVVSRLKRLGVAPAIVDREVLDAIRAGRIEIVAAVEALDERSVQLADGSRIEPDAVIAATGYRPGLKPIVGHLGVLDGHGAPRAIRGEAAPGLRFVGYDPRPAQLRWIGHEASRAAKAIARAAKPVPPTRLRAARALR